jgi:hypothetical protein
MSAHFRDGRLVGVFDASQIEANPPRGDVEKQSKDKARDPSKAKKRD